MLGGAAVAVALFYYLKSPGYALLLTAAAVVVPALLAARRAVRPVYRVLRAMQTSVACYSDGDFSISLVVDRRDELGELLRTNNELGNA
jgi:nitrogen fixation/metabolism regulation signal transduction histidine kinase